MRLGSRGVTECAGGPLGEGPGPSGCSTYNQADLMFIVHWLCLTQPLNGAQFNKQSIKDKSKLF